MKVLLVQPPSSSVAIGCDDVFIQEPLALEYTGAAIPEHHQVRILDLRLEDSFLDTLNEYQPDFVGFTALTIHVNIVKALSKQAKEFNNRIFTFIGGAHASICPNDFNEPFIDALLIGEGVFTFAELLQAIENGQGLSGIKGIAYRENEQFFINEPREYPPLDSFPLPDRSLTAKYRHQYFSEWLSPIASIRTSRGCPFKCKFCCCWKLAQGKYLTRDPRLIVEELKTISEPYVFFADDETFIDVKRMDMLADLIKESGIKKGYFAYVRSDTVIQHPELFKKWREIGMERVLIGMESHKETDLDEYNKKNSVETNKQSVMILQELGVSIIASFIIKQDYDTTDFDDLANYVKDLKLNTPSFPVLTPYPGTDLYQEVKDQIISPNYDLYDSAHTLLPTKLPLMRFYREISYLYLKCRSTEAVMAGIQVDPALMKNFAKTHSKLKKAYTHYT